MNRPILQRLPGIARLTASGEKAGARWGLPPAAAAEAAPAVLALMLVQWRRGALAWGLSRLVLGERALGPVPGLRFARVLGSGRDGGFGLVPSLERQGLIGFFDDEDSAHDFLQRSSTAADYRAHADERLIALLRVTSSRGSWGGQQLAVSTEARPGEPIVALTRAAIRPSRALAFRRHSPAAEASLRTAPGCRLAVGLGEAPLLRQATFSLWDDSAAMDAYARHGAHQRAIRGAWSEGWFSEWMFARLVPLLLQGRWLGKTFGAADG